MKEGVRKSGLVACVVGMAGSCFAQGSLTPPGAPAATMKTLEQVEPRIDVMTLAGDANSEIVITNSGSYYLSANLTVDKNYGIKIAADSVTLDLNGFEISRASGSTGYGIYILVGADGVTVRNGTIVGSFSRGIDDLSKGSLYEKLAVSGCAVYGIRSGESSRIIDCRVHDNLATGIYPAGGSSLDGCTASGNLGTGIFAIDELSLNSCIASDNEGHGIDVGSGSSLNGCIAENNQGSYGIRAGAGSSLEGCTARFNKGSHGIFVGDGSSLRGCTASDNSSDASVSYGIYAGDGSTVVECSAYSNNNTDPGGGIAHQGVGIFVSLGSTVKDCTATYNKGNGIWLGDSCTASENTCYSNGFMGDGAGIHASFNNRIIGNHVGSNDRGIEVTATGNTLGGNTAVDNSTNNYVIAAGNSYGDIIDNTGDAGSAPAHSGNGAAGGTISANNNPWANFSL